MGKGGEKGVRKPPSFKSLCRRQMGKNGETGGAIPLWNIKKEEGGCVKKKDFGKP